MVHSNVGMVTQKQNTATTDITMEKMRQWSPTGRLSVSKEVFGATGSCWTSRTLVSGG